MSKIGFWGLSHLGVVYSAVAAERGHDVVAFDEIQKAVQLCKRKENFFKEPSLDKIWDENWAKLKFTHDPGELALCDLVFLSMDVPTDDTDKSDLLGLKQSLQALEKIVGRKVPIIVLSQVPPGFMRQFSCSFDNLYYQVETLIFGNAVKRALEPERFILGTKTGGEPIHQKVKEFFASFASTPVFQMNYESAELAKISINCMLASTITATNVLAQICEKVGADWQDIIPVLQTDKRIGLNAYLYPGLGISGGNLMRDLKTIQDIAEKTKANVEPVDSWISFSEEAKNWCYKTLVSYVLPQLSNPKISILGLTYKENTNSTKNSPAFALMQKLKGYRVSAFDPVVKKIPFPEVSVADSISKCTKDADVIVVTSPWPEFQELEDKLCDQEHQTRFVIDPLGFFDFHRFNRIRHIEYFVLGRHRCLHT